MRNKSIRLNALLNIILTLSNIIFPLITFPYVSRILNPEGIGVVSFFSSIGNYGVLVASLGISTYGIRAVASIREDKNKLSRIVQELAVINIIMSGLVTLLLLGMALVIKQLSKESSLLLITSLTILSSPLALNWLYSGIEEYAYITKRSLIFKAFSLILIFLFVKKPADYVIYAGITLFSTLGSNILNVWHSRKFVYIKRYKNLEFKKHFKPMFYLFASLLAVNIYTNLDTVMLGFINGNEAVGYYSVASKVKWILLSLITSISAVLLPRLSFYISKKNTSKFNKMLKESSAVIFFIAIPLVAFFIVEAQNSIQLLGGEKYISATLSMQILMPILVISGFSNITGNQILIPMNRERYFMFAVSLGALVNLGLNLILMPKLGIIGASMATLFAELTQMTVQFIYSYKYLAGNISKNNLRNVILATVIATIILIVVESRIVLATPFLSLFIAGSTFFSIYLGILLLLKEEVTIQLLQFIKLKP
jgi:flippase wzx